jgi:hypothetical protein
MLSVTDLQKAYEKARFMHGWSEQNISSMMQGEKFKEKAYYILLERDLIKIELSIFLEMIKNEGITKVLKGLGVWKTTGKGANRMTVADPYIWVLVAMEMNPLLYAKVITWLTDSLIFNRLEAGSEYTPMNSAIKNIIEAPKYSEYATEINKKVFGKHIRGIRNLASSKELKAITDIEKFITNAISMQMIDNEQKLIQAIRNYQLSRIK